MNRRSKSLKIAKYCLIRYEVDEATGVLPSDLIKSNGSPLSEGDTVEAPFKGKYYSAKILYLCGT